MNSFVTIVSKISVFLGKICGMFYLAAIGLSMYEVFMRYGFDAPTSWTSETIMALVATAWLLSVGAVTQQRRHITVTTMELFLGARTWARLQKIAIAISMIGVVGLIIMLWDPMIKVLQSPQTTGSAFDPPTPTYIKTLFVVAACLYFLQLLANLLTPSTLDSTAQQSKN
ncbi:MAG: TRAP transporter small permease [Gammaproteobacteria bacterium]|nr:TRAP transporter small permease [Gammaproteobacteria bacterium]